MKNSSFVIFFFSLLTTSFLGWSRDNLDLGIPSQNGQLVDRTGYALLYSEVYEQPLWVSYKLTKDEIQNKVSKRTNNYRLDPYIETGSAVLSDYKGSGYDRGHLAPAADMAWSDKSMSESFFLSNISPQVPSFNRGIWRVLEEKIRKWVLEEEELYIITGPIIQPNHNTIGLHKVAVPHWYYKIIIDNYQPEVKAVAFIIPNRNTNNNPLSSFVVSIDQIEKKTNLDFLSRMPEKLQHVIESKVNLSEWDLPVFQSDKLEMDKIEQGSILSANQKIVLSISEKGLAGIDSKTEFSKDKIRELFPNFDIVEDVSSTEGEEFPIFRIKRDGQDILVINPTNDHQYIFSIQIKSKNVANELGPKLGSSYYQIYSDQTNKNCFPGVEELSGKVICSALRSKRLMYIFSGPWSGPDGVLPPIETLQSWKLVEIVWKP